MNNKYKLEYLSSLSKYGKSKTYIHNRQLSVISLLILAVLVSLGGMQKNYQHEFAQTFFDSVKAWNVKETSVTNNIKAGVTYDVKVFNTEIGINPKVASMPKEFHNLKHPDIDWKIYGLESSFGKNDSCKDQGKFNGFGFAENTFTWKCFDTFQEVANYVDDWVSYQLDQKDLSTALCYYNRGIVEKDCEYYQHYLSLNDN